MIYLNVIKKVNFDNVKDVEKTFDDAFTDTLVQIKQGNRLLRDDFISKYKPFILKVTSNALGKYIDIKNNDEYSVAMSAFNEAIDSYDLSRGYNFLLFCEQVIKRRLIDYLRKNKRGGRELPFSSFENSPELLEGHLINTDVSFENIEVKDEIAAYKIELKAYGISFMDLISSTPKHEDSRRLCIRIARILAEDESLFKSLVKNKSIPRNELKNKAKVHSRTIGNNRKYIIALTLMMKSNLELSKRYLKSTEEGGKKCE